MEVPWQNWFSDLDMDETEFFNQSLKTCSFDDDDEFLKEIFHQPCFSSESDSTHHSSSIHNKAVTTTGISDCGVSARATVTPTGISSLSHDNDSSATGARLKPTGSSSVLSKLGSFSDNKPTMVSSSPSTYILSFDNSTVLPATSDNGYRKHETASKSSGNQEKLESSTIGGGGNGGTTRASQKRTLENHNSDNHQPKPSQGTKKTRNSSETLDHIMAERKRRQELTEKFIALSATIPGLKKIDKASILSEAIIHVKQLQERVKELEEQNKKMMNSSVESSLSCMMKNKKKSSSSYNNCNGENIDYQNTTSNDDYYFRINEALPEVEARVLQSEVLIRIHCEKQKGVILNLLGQLHTLHFSIITHSVLPFGNSTLDITIIAEVDEEHNIPVKELVEKLRMTLLKKSSIE